MNMIICKEPCRNSCDGLCRLCTAGEIANASLSPCRYFIPQIKGLQHTVKTEAMENAYKNK